MTPEEMRQAARWYRKYGVNLLRQHTVLDAVGLMDANGRFDPQRLDRYDRWFAAIREQGIYTTWLVIYPHHGPFLQKHDGYAPLRLRSWIRRTRVATAAARRLS